MVHFADSHSLVDSEIVYWCHRFLASGVSAFQAAWALAFESKLKESYKQRKKRRMTTDLFNGFRCPSLVG
jgi:hypothetical protein